MTALSSALRRLASGPNDPHFKTITLDGEECAAVLNEIERLRKLLEIDTRHGWVGVSIHDDRCRICGKSWNNRAHIEVTMSNRMFTPAAMHTGVTPDTVMGIPVVVDPQCPRAHGNCARASRY